MPKIETSGKELLRSYAVTYTQPCQCICIVYVNVYIASDFKLIWQSLINK